jgi:glucokinase
MSPKNQEYVVGIDLGGTKIYAAVVDRKGRILGVGRKRTKVELGFDVTVERMVTCVRDAITEAKVDFADIIAIGVGSPGPLDLKKGSIIETPNLKWKDAPLKARLKDALKRPVSIDNDGNVGLLGEFAYGAGHGSRDMVGLFIGTGIGGGVIINGKLLHGFNENAAELGHMILNPDGPLCGCGNHGCLEAFASRLAIEREIRAAITNGTASTILDGVEKPEAPLRSKRLSEAYAAKDQATVYAIEKSAVYVGYGVASLLNIFNPEVVVIGGGVVEAIGEPYVQIVQQIASQNVFKIALRNVRIVSAELKDDSAVLGAAMLAWQKAYK